MGRAGRRRALLEIQSASEHEGRDGETVRRWGEHAQAWAYIIPLSGRELAEARQVDERTSHEIRFPFIECPRFSSRFRLRYLDPERGERIFNVANARDSNERRREWVVQAEEVFDAAEAPDIEG